MKSWIQSPFHKLPTRDFEGTIAQKDERSALRMPRFEELKLPRTGVVLQIRRLSDPMLNHERRCFERRLSGCQIRFHNVFQETPNRQWLDDSQTLIIGGSGSLSVHDYEARPWMSELRELMEIALERNLPTLGICFGHQLLGLHLGATVVDDGSGHERGTIDIHLTAEGEADPMLRTYGKSLAVNTGHMEHVEDLPNHLRLLGATEDVEGQIFKVSGKKFYSTQFHPELLASEAKQRYRAFAAEYSEELMTSLDEDLASFSERREESENFLRDFVSRMSDSDED